MKILLKNGRLVDYKTKIDGKKDILITDESTKCFRMVIMKNC